jgi:hypothetical protein
MRLLAFALDRAQPLDDVRQHLVDAALAAVDLLDDVQRLQRVMQRLGLDRLGELDFVVGREQADAPDLLEVHAHGVVERDRVHHLNVDQHLVIDLLDLFEVLLAVGDLDPDLLEDGEDAEDLVRLGVDLGETLEDVVGRQVALLLALDDQLLGDRNQLVFELGLRSLRSLGCAPRPGLDRSLYYTCDLLPARFHVTDGASKLPCLRRSGASGVPANLICLLSAIFELSRVLAWVEQVFWVVAGVALRPAHRERGVALPGAPNLREYQVPCVPRNLRWSERDLSHADRRLRSRPVGCRAVNHRCGCIGGGAGCRALLSLIIELRPALRWPGQLPPRRWSLPPG